MEAFSNNGDISNLMIANDNISTQLTQLTTLISLGKKSRAEKPLRSLETAVDRLGRKFGKKLEEYEESVVSAKSELSDTIATAETLKTTLNSHKTDTANLIAQWQDQFSQAQEQRSQEFSAAQTNSFEKFEIKVDSIISTSNEKLKESFRKFTSNIEGYISSGKEQHEKILELSGLVAGDSVGSSFNKNADDEQKQANIWRVISIMFIIGTIIWLVVAYCINFNASETPSFNWLKLFSTVSLTAAFFFGAGYAAQQSTRHRETERNARKFALEVKAIDPFIASLPPEDQQKLKHSLSEKLFGNNILMDNSVNSKKESTALDIIKDLTEILNKWKG